MGGAETAATRELRALNPSLERAFLRLTDSVFVAAGYGMSTFAFVVGDTGIVAVDAGSTPAESVEAIGELRRHSDLPLLGIIYTHHHFDHTYGAVAFIEENPDIQIWAIEPFGGETLQLACVGTTALQRALRQFGHLVPEELHINSGFASAAGARGFRLDGLPDPRIAPTRWFRGSTTVRLGGVELEVSHNPGETDDQVLVWFAAERVAFAGDNVYRSWPNLYAIRGSRYRDVRAWCEAVDRIRALEPDHLVLGHTLPISGAGEVAEALDVYSRGLWHVYHATIEGMNAGRTPDELVEEVRLPDDLADHPLLREYYGTVAWSVRSIFNGVLGWFDGNPTRLNPLHPAERARRVAGLAGGAGVLLERAGEALAGGDAQWAAELCDMLLALDFEPTQVMALKADALDEIASGMVTATGRNYLHSCARELRESSDAAG
ncbi:MAG: alkyl/aryl-sulfatase [Acidimicrobiia bacterium]|nr:alkyl/aryl-sulfatase [Acidimicrobiia bacterium]MYC44152.1 alkyl/aryl-sulfatase [Acidimicrobiia bacterium]MYI20698.1 alkyl/aryl-sulfatase [Acidimicrobiia bacterium]